MESRYGNTKREWLLEAFDAMCKSFVRFYDNRSPGARLFVDIMGVLLVTFWTLVCLVIIL